MQPHNPTAMTIADFCTKYNIHRSTFYRNVKTGQMPPIIKVGSATRILVEDEQAWLCAQRKTLH
jgi:predicted DNA-binding transcriptional regulator AlpA